MAITISSTEPRVQYTATSGQTSFTVGFEFFNNSDLKVYNGSSLLTYAASPSSGSQYSVSGAGASGGGSITLGSGGATLNDIITIYRDMSIARSTDFPTSGTFQVESLNEELDKLRHSATRSLLTRNDVLIVASVSCIYGLGPVETYSKMVVNLKVNDNIPRDILIKKFIKPCRYQYMKIIFMLPII